jgi:hypothetical protein
VKVGAGTTVHLFTQNKFKGRTLTLNSNIACLVSKRFNDVTASARVVRHKTPVRPGPIKVPRRPSKGCVLVFEHCNYQGRWRQLCFDVPNLARYSFSRNISSVKVFQGIKATFFVGANFKGASQVWTRDDSCFVKRKFNDKAFSVRIRKRVVPGPKPRPLPPKPVPRPIVPAPKHPKTGCIFMFQHANYLGMDESMWKNSKFR